MLNRPELPTEPSPKERAARRSGARPRRGPRDESVKSARRALAILETLTATERPLVFGELAEALGYPRSSLHGLLRTLIDAGWVDLDPVGRRYSLGIRAWEAGHAYLRATSLAERALPYMKQVRDELNEAVQLAVLDGRHNVYIAKVEGSQKLVLASEVGRRLEAHATGLGKVLLADLSSSELEACLGETKLERYTASTITDRRRLKAELELIRGRGYALDSEEYTVGVRCVAVPIRDHTGRVVAAMSVSVPTIRFTRERIGEAMRALRSAAHGLSSALGH